MQFTALLAEVEWPSAFVAISLIALIGVIMVSAIKKYSTHEVLQIWAGLGVLLGIMTGSFGTYFFTDKAIKQQEQVAQENAKRADFFASQLKASDEALSNQVALTEEAGLGSKTGDQQTNASAAAEINDQATTAAAAAVEPEPVNPTNANAAPPGSIIIIDHPK
jgi:hypothetical protein